MTTLTVFEPAWSKTRKGPQKLKSGNTFCVANKTESNVGKVLLSSTRETWIYLVHGWSEYNQEICPETGVSLPAFNSLDTWSMWNKSPFCSCLHSLSCDWEQERQHQRFMPFHSTFHSHLAFRILEWQLCLFKNKLTIIFRQALSTCRCSQQKRNSKVMKPIPNLLFAREELQGHFREGNGLPVVYGPST